ncbi:MAG: RpiB/LacA/LacB family sugar-phosphate isomerase [Bacilli bacterium]
MIIVLGSDHGGFKYKKYLIEYLESHGFKTIDVGTFNEDAAAWSKFGIAAAEKVANHEADLGIVICKSGQGVAMAANKVKGAYCGIGYNDDNSHLIKEHDGANMIAFGSAYTTKEELINRSMMFITSQFEGGRHEARLNILKDYENKH